MATAAAAADCQAMAVWAAPAVKLASVVRGVVGLAATVATARSGTTTATMGAEEEEHSFRASTEARAGAAEVRGHMCVVEAVAASITQTGTTQLVPAVVVGVVAKAIPVTALRHLAMAALVPTEAEAVAEARTVEPAVLVVAAAAVMGVAAVETVAPEALAVAAVPATASLGLPQQVALLAVMELMKQTLAAAAVVRSAALSLMMAASSPSIIVPLRIIQ